MLAFRALGRKRSPNSRDLPRDSSAPWRSVPHGAARPRRRLPPVSATLRTLRADRVGALVEAAFAMAAAVEVFTDKNTGNGGWGSPAPVGKA